VVDRVPRRWPIATTSVLAVTVVVTVPQFPFRRCGWQPYDAGASAAGAGAGTLLTGFALAALAGARGGDTAAQSPDRPV
jgi:hypothetical protein